MGAVYFLRELADPRSPVKIGWVESPDRCPARVSELQVGNWRRIGIVSVRDGTRDDESALHERFAAWRIGGEWFAPVRPVLMEMRRTTLIDPICAGEPRVPLYAANDILAMSEGGHAPEEIAARLNEDGITGPKGGAWTAERVESIVARFGGG